MTMELTTKSYFSHNNAKASLVSVVVDVAVVVVVNSDDATVDTVAVIVVVVDTLELEIPL